MGKVYLESHDFIFITKYFRNSLEVERKQQVMGVMEEKSATEWSHQQSIA
jgi:hypothetical protein